MDRDSFHADLDMDDDLELDLGDGGEAPPPPVRTGGGRGSGSSRGTGRSYRVWPWILGIVGVLAIERFALQGLLQTLDLTGLTIAAGIAVFAVAAAIAVGGTWMAQQRR